MLPTTRFVAALLFGLGVTVAGTMAIRAETEEAGPPGRTGPSRPQAAAGRDVADQSKRGEPGDQSGGAASPGAELGGLTIIARERAGSSAPLPVVRVKQPTVGPAGPLDEAGLRRYFMKQTAPELRRCYQRALHTRPTLTGVLTVRFVVAASGAVRTAEVARGLLAELDTCVVEQVKKTTFPAPRGGGELTIVYPFTFIPER